jgi:mitofusin
MSKLRQRVQDTSSKVLVTGDLNAGKSTLVNALLRRSVMPVDQQPCTTAFCEVHDASENDGVEEVHVIKAGVVYSVKDESTFTRAQISDLEDIISEDEKVQPIIKVYINDPRASSHSLLNNGIADISLIDAPGLNRDSLKTTALFARQEEIDVVVFVVSAENHFTLSAKEFLLNASNEKAYVFIVVNKYEQIKNKEKCRRAVLEQIKVLSPRTYEDAEDLVHFVDAASVSGGESSSQAFDALELALRSFVLLKRSKSKLHPAATYLNHLITDIDLLVGANAIVARSELDRANSDLQRAKPVFEKMKSGRDGLEESLERVEEAGASTSSRKTKQILHDALEKVGSGELALVKSPLQMPSYEGLFRIMDYTRDVRRALLESLDAAVKLAEDEARATTTKGVANVNVLADKYLPEGVERSRRTFMPEAMFSRRKNAKGEKGGAIVAGGMYGLGIGLSHNQELLEPSLLDLFDIHHQFSVLLGDKDKVEEDEEEGMSSALGVASMGIGALTIVTGKTLGARSVLESLFRISEIFGNPSARKWAGPIIGAFTIGLSVYFVLELPNTIPRTVGRRIRKQLLQPQDGSSSSASEETTFINLHATRVSRETRKVLRIASWDLRERFRCAMEESGKEVKNAEEVVRKSDSALKFFDEIKEEALVVREDVEAVGVL